MFHPITTELQTQIHATIDTLTKILIRPDNIQYAYIPLSFATTYPKSTTLIALMYRVVQALFLLPFISSEDSETLNVCQNMLTLIQNQSNPQHPSLSTFQTIILPPSTSSTDIPSTSSLPSTSTQTIYPSKLSTIEDLATIDQDLPYLFVSPTPSSDLSQQISIPILPSSSPHSMSFLTSSESSLDIEELAEQASLPSELSLDIEEFAEQASLPSELSLDIEEFAEQASLPSEEDLEIVSPLRTISPLYDPENLPTVQPPFPENPSFFDYSEEEVTKNEETKIHHHQAFSSFSLLDMDIGSPSGHKMTCRELLEDDDTKMKALLTKLAPWPVRTDIQKIQMNHYHESLSFNKIENPPRIVVAKVILSFKTNAMKNNLKRVETVLKEIITYNDIPLLIPETAPTKQGYVSRGRNNADLLLNIGSSCTKEEGCALQWLYLLKLYLVLLKKAKYSKIPVFITDAIQTFSSVIKQEKSFTSTETLPSSSLSPSISSSNRKRAASSTSTDYSKAQKLKSELKAVIDPLFSYGPYYPITSETLAPLLLSEQEFLKLIPEHCFNVLRNQTSSSLSSLSLSIYNTLNDQPIRNFRLDFSFHKLNALSWLKYFQTFFVNLICVINEPMISHTYNTRLLLPNYNPDHFIHRLLQVFFFLKIMDAHFSHFSNIEIDLPQIYIERLQEWKNNLLIILQRYPHYIDSQFYEVNRIIPSSAHLLKYEELLTITNSAIDRIVWPFTIQHSRQIESIHTEQNNEYPLPVIIMKKTILNKPTYTTYLNHFFQSIQTLTDPANLILPLQISDPDIALERPPGASEELHRHMQALFLWKICYRKMQNYWQTKTSLQNPQNKDEIIQLEKKCISLFTKFNLSKDK